MSKPSQGTSAPPVLEVRTVVAGYGVADRDGVPSFPVLRDVAFTIMAGTTLGVVGESGCGKGTLARRR
ncbi:ATP-binding cassette domain-containing protein [Bradyrhizobium sp. CCGB12]|nr:ATP-binding cassette domain-containing protein [Bradyrhizobium sp. CCGB12]MCP3392244.1 ATP-binding cassette domain-containing protein [Bradyrhizobium sp. CCGB12]